MRSEMRHFYFIGLKSDILPPFSAASISRKMIGILPMATVRVIFVRIFTARKQKRLLVSFHQNSITAPFDTTSPISIQAY